MQSYFMGERVRNEQVQVFQDTHYRCSLKLKNKRSSLPSPHNYRKGNLYSRLQLCVLSPSTWFCSNSAHNVRVCIHIHKSSLSTQAPHGSFSLYYWIKGSGRNERVFFDVCVLNMLFLIIFQKLESVENKVASMSTILIMSGLFCYSKNIWFQTQNNALEQAEETMTRKN